MGLGDLDSDDDGDEPDEEEVIDVEPKEVETKPAPEQGGVIKPVDELEEIADTYKQFERIKAELLDKESDIQRISGNPFITKSGWRKIATAFNLSVRIVDSETWVEDGIVKVRVQAEASAPNGKTSGGVGMCASNEPNFMDSVTKDTAKPKEELLSEYDNLTEDNLLLIDGKWRRLPDPREVNEHDVFATAATRAKNRAISDCVGGGEVSAEEVSKSKEDVLGSD